MASVVKFNNSRSGKKSRNKGAVGEREFIRRVHHLTDGAVNLRRNLSQCRDSGDDTGVFDFSIEIKRWQKVSDALVRDWWSQCYRNANDAEKIPVLAFRADHRSWQVMMHPNAFFQEHDVRGCICMDIELFCQYLLHPTAMAKVTGYGAPA